MWLILFVLGLAAGSFLKVVADRYEPSSFLWDKKIIAGRSFCPYCKKQLRWFELIPLFSFFWQRGRCGSCGKRISWSYPAVEIISGLIFVFIPLRLKNFYILYSLPATAFGGGRWQADTFYILSALWILVFLILLLISLIDWRLNIIPDEADIFLLILGAALILVGPFGLLEGSFLKNYALIFGWRDNVWLNHLIAVLLAAAFFGFLILVSRGRAMGMGDLKLAAVLGWLFGWPDILLMMMLAFILGSIVGLAAIIFKKKTFKSYLAFAPFLAIAALLVFGAGDLIMNFYFGFFPV